MSSVGHCYRAGCTTTTERNLQGGLAEVADSSINHVSVFKDI